jgi:hypothetical protein
MSWDDRVVEALTALRRRDEADKEEFHALCTYMSTPNGRRDGERLERDGDTGTKLYKGEPVYLSSVKAGHTIVRAIGGKPESYADREQALDRMAELLARAINDPSWGEQPARGEQSQKPLY